MIYGNCNYVDYKKNVYENVYIFEFKENMVYFCRLFYRESMYIELILAYTLVSIDIIQPNIHIIISKRSPNVNMAS